MAMITYGPNLSSSSTISQWFTTTTASTTDAWIVKCYAHNNPKSGISISQSQGGWLAEDASPIRRPPPREFNRFINASDLLEEFIHYLGTLSVKKSEVMELPVELFIKWLIIRACEADGEEPNVEMPLKLIARRGGFTIHAPPRKRRVVAERIQLAARRAAGGTIVRRPR